MEFEKFLANARARSGENEGHDFDAEIPYYAFVSDSGLSYRRKSNGEGHFAEFVFNNGEPFWFLDYRPEIRKPNACSPGMYAFLRSILWRFSGPRMLRGPDSFKGRMWRYSNEVEGDLNAFRGVETIYRRGEMVYRASYHGGMVNGTRNT